MEKCVEAEIWGKMVGKNDRGGFAEVVEQW